MKILSHEILQSKSNVKSRIRISNHRIILGLLQYLNTILKMHTIKIFFLFQSRFMKKIKITCSMIL